MNAVPSRRVCGIAHLSDFHFAGELTERGRRLWTKQWVKSHSFEKIDALSQTFFEFRRLDTTPDLIIVTGDVCTDGSNESLSTALKFIEESKVYCGTPARLTTYGLGSARDCRVVVPGNHDRYGIGILPVQRTSDALEQVFGSPKKYPYLLGYAPSGSGEAALLFFIFDSTLPEWKTAPTWSRIAQGWIPPAQSTWLVEQANALRSGGKVQGLDGRELGVNFDAAARIVVLHHHPVRVQAGDQTMTMLQNASEFVDACFEAKISVVLFGHEHVRQSIEMARGGHIIRFLCCPSTSEFNSKVNGFYMLNFYQPTRIDVDTYTWNPERRKFEKFDVGLASEAAAR